MTLEPNDPHVLPLKDLNSFQRPESIRSTAWHVNSLQKTFVNECENLVVGTPPAAERLSRHLQAPTIVQQKCLLLFELLERQIRRYDFKTPD